MPAGVGPAVELLPFAARHERTAVTRGLHAFDLDGLDVTMLPVPRALLYEMWNTAGFSGPASLSRALGPVDVIHAPSVAVPPKGRAKLVVTVHDAAPVLFPAAYTRRGRWFHQRGFAATAARADAVIAPTAAAADEVAAHTSIAREQIRVVHHGVSPPMIGPEDEARARALHHLGAEPFVLWVGTLEPRKNVATLLEAFRLLIEKSEVPHRLVLAGPDGWLNAADEIRATARALGDRVRLTGSVTGVELFALYRAAELFVLPSRHEGFGMPALEAMSQGTPVLAADIPALREVGGDVARFANPEVPDAWTDAMLDLLEDDASRADLGQRGVARAARFHWKKAVSQHLAVYRDVMR